MSGFSFEVKARDGAARTGVIETPRGEIRTPAFMPVGTAGTVKAMFPEDVRATGADVILGNTYHLMLRPGAERVAALGGLHEFMNWPRPIHRFRRLSGDVLVLAAKADGRGRFLRIAYRRLAPHADAGALDRNHRACSAPTYRCSSMNVPQFRSPMTGPPIRCACRCAGRRVQKRAGGKGASRHGAFRHRAGANFEDLRRESLDSLMETGFDGYSIGGLAVGEGREEMFRVLDFTTPHMAADKPRYLMGVGKPADIVGAVARGVDMSDCVLPMRDGTGRRGRGWAPSTSLTRAFFADDETPLDPHSACPASRDYSKAYLHHLFKAGE
ncbi:MAG: tRNA guanosine(34) transglycosylase Tgt [Parvularculaceae bacterium]